jgi:hypothetical protein
VDFSSANYAAVAMANTDSVAFRHPSGSGTAPYAAGTTRIQVAVPNTGTPADATVVSVVAFGDQ